MHVADLHCDLLLYLAHKKERHAENEEARCSLPQLKKGGVCLQTLAVFVETGSNSVASAEQQFAIFLSLPKWYPKELEHLKEKKIPTAGQKIHIAAAIENASGLCEEKEPLENGFRRLVSYSNACGHLLYLSLTWNHENRFGGGNLSTVGLKDDGKHLLEFLSGKKIAIDLSHTSDALAHDILNYIDKKGLNLTPIASHSNFRTIADRPRNLPDGLAKEIARRGGVIGLNFVRAFIGQSLPEDFKRQVQYASTLISLDCLCLGSDFFYDNDPISSLNPLKPFFFERFGNSSCFPDFLQFLSDSFSHAEIEKIAHKNLERFFGRQNS